MNNLSVIDQVKVLVRYNGKYLLLKKVKDIHPDHIGCFEVPGGKVKPKEDSIFAALREVKEETGLNCKIKPIRTEEYPLPASRPAFSVMDTRKFSRDFNFDMPYWQDSMKICLENVQLQK